MNVKKIMADVNMNVRTLSAASYAAAVMDILKACLTPPDAWISMSAWRGCRPALTASTNLEGNWPFVAGKPNYLIYVSLNEI